MDYWLFVHYRVLLISWICPAAHNHVSEKIANCRIWNWKWIPDSFPIAINKEYMLINGFAYDETLEAVEAWADTQDAMA